MDQINYLAHASNLFICQNDDYFKMSLDSVLLPKFININKHTKNILDLGTGNAPIPLYLSKLTDAKIIGVEIQKEIFDLAKKSITLNNLDNQIEIINEDIKKCVDIFKSDFFDIITCNPPFFKVNENKMLNENKIKTIARHEVLVNIEDICKVARKLLKNNGSLALVHRSNRLVDILSTMRKYNLEPKRIRFVYTKNDLESNIILVEGRKNGREGIKVLKPLYIYDENGKYSKEAKAIFEVE